MGLLPANQLRPVVCCIEPNGPMSFLALLDPARPDHPLLEPNCAHPQTLPPILTVVKGLPLHRYILQGSRLHYQRL
jgi:hypothetical protein